MDIFLYVGMQLPSNNFIKQKERTDQNDDTHPIKNEFTGLSIRL